MKNPGKSEVSYFCQNGIKKILNSLPKHRFDFMLHRLIIHRNRYTEYCHSHNKYPLLPSMKPTKKPSWFFLVFYLYMILLE